MTRLLLFVAAVLTLGYAAGMRRVCYYTNWAQYRPGTMKFFPENVDPTLCTHVIYSFAKMTGNHLAAFEWNDESTAWMKGMYERFHDHIKSNNPSVKTLLAVGGWNMGSAPFTAMVANAANRQAFVTQSIKFLRDNNFDGLDLDWEYPANRGSPPQDKQHFVELVQLLRKEYSSEAARTGKPELLISAAVPAGIDKIDSGYDVHAVEKELDFINLMTYDLHGSWEDHTGHNAPLHKRASETGDEAKLNVETAAKYWVSKGAPKSKMNIGVPLYGRTFKISGSGDTSIGCPASGAGAAGQYTREAGFLAYYEVCSLLKSGAQKKYDSEGQVPYLVQNTLWCGYDDPDSLKIKVDFIKREGFGGVMVWALDLDDFTGSCGQGKFPLMRAINDELSASTGTGPVTSAPVTSAPLTTTAAVTQAPVTNAPITNAPVTNAPVTNAPVTNPPTTPSASGSSHHDLTLVSNNEFDCTSKQDGYYPSPTSCSDYYICANSMPFRTDCHPGLVFNPSTLYCDFSDHVSCTANKNPAASAPVTQAPMTAAPVTAAPVTAAPVTQAPVTAAPTTKRPVTQRPGAVNPADFCKGKSDGFFKDPVDCSHFYQCSFEVSYHEVCPAGTYFSESLQGCDWAANVPSCP